MITVNAKAAVKRIALNKKLSVGMFALTFRSVVFSSKAYRDRNGCRFCNFAIKFKIKMQKNRFAIPVIAIGDEQRQEPS